SMRKLARGSVILRRAATKDLLFHAHSGRAALTLTPNTRRLQHFTSGRCRRMQEGPRLTNPRDHMKFVTATILAFIAAPLAAQDYTAERNATVPAGRADRIEVIARAGSLR